MYTQCPDCQVAFRITAEVLQQARGQVRCGNCGDAFNALDHLFESPPVRVAPAAPPPVAPGVDDAIDEDEHSEELMNSLEELPGPKNVRIEDTGFEWRVVGDEDDDELPAPFTKKPKSELRFDDNTPLPDDFFDDEDDEEDAAPEAAPVYDSPMRRSNDFLAVEQAARKESQSDLELSETGDWTELLDEVGTSVNVDADPAEDADLTAAVADDPEPVAAEGEDTGLHDAEVPQAPQDDAQPMAADAIGSAVTSDEEPSDPAQPEEDAVAEHAEAIDDAEPPAPPTEGADDIAAAVDELDEDFYDDELKLADDEPETEDADVILAPAADDPNAAELDGDLAIEKTSYDDAESPDAAADIEEIAHEPALPDAVDADPVISADTSVEVEAVELAEADAGSFDAIENDEAALELDDAGFIPDLADDDPEAGDSLAIEAVAEEVEAEPDEFAGGELDGEALEDAGVEDNDLEEDEPEDDIAAMTANMEIDPEVLRAMRESRFDETLTDDSGSPLYETIIMEGDDVRAMYDEDTGPRRTLEDGDPASLLDTYVSSRAAAKKFIERPFVPVLALVVLLAGLGAQLIHTNREALATMPLFARTIGPIYASLGMPVVPDWDVTGWQFEATSGSTGADASALLISSRIANRSEDALPYPLVHLSLTDRYEEIVGSRVLEPNDYLDGNADASQPVASGSSFTANIAVDTPSPNATGFKLNVCYRELADQVRCAVDDFK